MHIYHRKEIIMFKDSNGTFKSVEKSTVAGIARVIAWYTQDCIKLFNNERNTLHALLITCLSDSSECYVVRYLNSDYYVVTPRYATACMAMRGTDSILIHVVTCEHSSDIKYRATIYDC